MESMKEGYMPRHEGMAVLPRKVWEGDLLGGGE